MKLAGQRAHQPKASTSSSTAPQANQLINL